MNIKNFEIQNLGMGIVLFKNVINVDQSLIIPFLSSLKEKALQEDYTFIYNSDNNPIYAINRSGHRYSLDDIGKSCNHIMNFLDQDSNNEVVEFFKQCEDIMYQCLLRYVEIFPMLLPCLWWRTQGHVVAYSPGARFGLHCDNDINYSPGAEPDQQLAIRNVVGGLIYFNSSVDNELEIKENEYIGGELYFPYANINYKPSSGDLIMFPSNYLATHEVKECKFNNRYAYVGYFAQGSESPERGVQIRQPSDLMDSGQVWMPEIFNDYIKYIQNKYSDKKDLDRLLEPTRRQFTSHGTNEELRKNEIQ